MEEQKNPLKIVLVGDELSNKASLLYAFTLRGSDITPEHRVVPRDIGSYLLDLKIGDSNISVQIFQSGGQESFDQIRTLIYPNTHMFMVCYSCVHPETLGNVKEIWVPELRIDVPNVPFILVGNNSELKDEVPEDAVREEDAIVVMKAVGAKAQFQCSSADTIQGLDDFSEVNTIFETAVKLGWEYYNELPGAEAAVGLKCTTL